MKTQHPLSVLEAFNVFARAYRLAFFELAGRYPSTLQISKRFQTIKHVQQTEQSAELIGTCHGYMDS